MIFKLNLQLFSGGAGDAAREGDEYDLDPGNKYYDFKVGNNTYSVPLLAFDNVGRQDNNVSYQTRMTLAGIYTAYMLSNKKDLPTSYEGNTGERSGTYLYDEIADEWYKDEWYKKINTEELSGTSLYDEIAEWYKKETGTELSSIISKDSATSTLEELATGAFIKNMPAFITSGQVTVNGTPYNDWIKNQPQFQPGYSETLGAPVAKDANGKYIYKDKNGDLVNASGSAIPEDTLLYSPKTGAEMVIGADGSFRDAITGEVINDPNKPSVASATETAFNQYYSDLYSREEGTLGADILANNISLYEKEAANAQLVAETSMQQQAIAQAQAVKQITDSIRSERMAQLRAGMSEAQLADREIGMLVGATNQLSAQATQASQDVFTAKVGATTAREQAFNDYITQTTTLGQNAAAMYASEAGDLHAQALNYRAQMAAEGRTISYKQAVEAVSGQAYKANSSN